MANTQKPEEQQQAPQPPATVTMTQEQYEQLTATLKSQGEQIAAITQAQAAAPAQVTPADEGTVKVLQYNTSQVGNKSVKFNEMEQTYTKSEYEKLNAPHPQDPSRSGFEVLGLSHDVLEDTGI